jgi:hypothetical protein
VPTARVIYHYEDGSWWAESPEVPGWSATGATFAEVRGLAADGIPWSTERPDWQLRHIVPAEFLSFFKGGTAGAVARVSMRPTATLVVSTVGPLAGIPNEHEVLAA